MTRKGHERFQALKELYLAMKATISYISLLCLYRKMKRTKLTCICLYQMNCLSINLPLGINDFFLIWHSYGICITFCLNFGVGNGSLDAWKSMDSVTRDTKIVGCSSLRQKLHVLNVVRAFRICVDLLNLIYFLKQASTLFGRANKYTFDICLHKKIHSVALYKEKLKQL